MKNFIKGVAHAGVDLVMWGQGLMIHPRVLPLTVKGIVTTLKTWDSYTKVPLKPEKWEELTEVLTESSKMVARQNSLLQEAAHEAIDQGRLEPMREYFNRPFGREGFLVQDPTAPVASWDNLEKPVGYSIMNGRAAPIKPRDDWEDQPSSAMPGMTRRQYNHYVDHMYTLIEAHGGDMDEETHDQYTRGYNQRYGTKIPPLSHYKNTQGIE